MDCHENYGSSCVLIAACVYPAADYSSVRLSRRRQRFPTFLGIFGALMFAGFAYAHRIVYGFVDAGGIHYHRYLRWKYVKWEQIESIARRHMGTIHVDVEGQNFPSRHLVFVRDSVVFGEKSKSVTFDALRGMWIRARKSPYTALEL